MHIIKDQTDFNEMLNYLFLSDISKLFVHFISNFNYFCGKRKRKNAIFSKTVLTVILKLKKTCTCKTVIKL